jgi:hypothetical protein
MKSLKRCLSALAVVLTSVTLQAQTFGEITGSITDSSAAVVPAATVTIINTQTNQTRTVQTNESGNYTVPFLVPGSYELRVQQQGFKGAVHRGIQLQVGDVARVDFTLEIGGHRNREQAHRGVTFERT